MNILSLSLFLVCICILFNDTYALKRSKVSLWSSTRMKQYLRERDVECKGCTDKMDYIDLILEVQDKPIVASKYQPGTPAYQREQQEKYEQDPEVQEMMRKMKREGGNGGSNTLPIHKRTGDSAFDIREALRAQGYNVAEPTPEEKAEMAKKEAEQRRMNEQRQREKVAEETAKLRFHDDDGNNNAHMSHEEL